MLPLVLTLSLLAPTLVLAGMYPKNSAVKMLDDAAFRKAMKEERTSVTAFVAPWCGHCQKLTPEFIKAAESLAPLIPFYAVDCDAEENKRLCSEQGVKGFPTIKSFPRGSKGVPHDYNGERKAGDIVNWASGEVPSRVKTLKGADAISKWASEGDAKLPRILLLTKQPKIPVLWKVLGWTHHKTTTFGATKDETGDIIKALGVDAPADGKTKVLVWAPGATEPTLYSGTLKFDPLSQFVKTLPDSAARSEL